MNILLLLMIPLLGFDSWESIGPEGGEVRAVLQSTQYTGTLYALSGSYPTQVVRSLDNGSTWTNISDFTGGTPCDMTMTADGKLVIVGYYYVWVSEDEGMTWTEYYHSNSLFWDTVAHPTVGDDVFAAGHKYDGDWNFTFFHSTDGGVTWNDIALINSSNDSYGWCITISSSNPDVILTGGYEFSSGTIPYLFLSTDGGTSFSDVTPAEITSSHLYGVGVHPVNPDIMLVSSSNIYRSADGGSSWTQVSSMNGSKDISFSNVDPDLILAGGYYYSIHKSTDCGESWSTVYTGLEGDNVNWIVPDALNSSIAYTGSNLGFFYSSDSGNSWTMQNSGMIVGRVLAMEYTNGYIFMNMEDQGLFKTVVNPTIAWEEVPTPLSCGDFCAIESTGGDTLLILEGAG